MDNRTMLELAAKAAGIEYTIEDDDYYVSHKFFGLWLVKHHEPSEYEKRYWNPLTDDGDALRLAIDLQLGISIPPVVDGRIDVVTFYGPILSVIEYPVSGDRHAATRRAITRAAAEIQMSKEKQNG